MTDLENTVFGASKDRRLSTGLTKDQPPHFIHRTNAWLRLLAGVLLGLTGLLLTWLSLPDLAQAVPPVVVNDSYTLAEDTSLVVPGAGVLSNDNDADGDDLSASVSLSPTHGILTFNSSGSFTYTPAVNFAGQDSFSYVADDGNGGTATGVVTLKVNPTNDPPVVGQAKVLYEGALGTLPISQSFAYASFFGTSVQTFAGGLTTLDTTPNRSDSAGYVHAPPTYMTTLNRNSGYTLRFAAQVVTESHTAGSDNDGDGLADRAGFSVIALGHDNFGIELGFWTNRVWAQDDGLAEPPPASITRTLFTQAEGVPFNTTSLITYELTISGMAYNLTANGTEILSGSLRNYTALPFLEGGFVYQTPNLIFLGDDTPSAQTQVRLGYISVITNITPPDQATTPATDLPIPGLGVFDLDGDSGQETLRLTVNNGLLTVSPAVPGGVSAANISGNGTATLVMTGTLNQLNQTLSQRPTFLTYRSLPAFVGVDTVTLTLNDRGFTGGSALTASRSFNILVISPRLTLVKEASHVAPRPGERITYTLTISNSGNQEATGGVVSDTLPAGLSLAGPITLTPPGAGTVGTPPTLASGLTIAAGQQVTVTLPVTVDSSLANGDMITNTASITISNPEIAVHDSVSLVVTVPQIQFQRANYSVAENKGPAVITVTVTPSPLVTTSVVISSSDGTASRLSDYGAISRTLIFSPGVNQVVTTVTISDNVLFEGTETVKLSLSSPVYATLGARATAALLILDNDTPPPEPVYLPLLVKNAP